MQILRLNPAGGCGVSANRLDPLLLELFKFGKEVEFLLSVSRALVQGMLVSSVISPI